MTMNNYPAVDHRLCQVLAQTSLKKTKNKKRILFFDRDAFADNTKYLYLHMVKNPQLECIWCTWNEAVYDMLQKHHLPVHLLGKNNDETINLLLEAQIAIFCVNPHHSLHRNWSYFACLEGAKHIQLWHGISVKNLLLQLTPYFSMTDLGFSTSLAWASRTDYVLSTAEVLNPYWREVFGCDNIINASYPRNEVLLRNVTPLELLGSKIDTRTMKAITSKRKKIFIAPTWQRFDNTEILSKEMLTQLLLYTSKNNIDVFIKTHPYRAVNFDSNALKINNFYFIDADVDVYPFLNRFDALITDYSSIMFDFLLTKKPVLTLDIAPGEHANFEPNYALLPINNKFRYTFTKDNITSVLYKALFKDDKAVERELAVSRLFPNDSTNACQQMEMLIIDILEDIIC
ncbi:MULTISPECIES: CDP-glycerol glycerophosphotransferase family protein [Citrobacter]|uniref:CDP-glycerol glycerophosphotransferase family protein n=1 Tax=Citrobacter TaxID=544 RepID=UPI0019062E6A|nr:MULTISPECIES: CDP-glycerol glycerophosphotransferase family protein [Citrobacter]MBJ9261446.1 CDP-glycerol glycerophosphotransferase family protein [Citrobacter braakii]MBN4808457.1 CDP-glycerol glycerophosphotransferase family protein [Citrobacter braakii]MBN4814131.1 CDP-glycerol glycerophosphotransferase family protein [Citrobacter braakii]MBN4822954.1 CDP-glycerol glycerophosphotransferase family protein [Citrobacter braakii]MBN4838182.1 CDP-glycerol glycerophosphotransferase family pro